MDREELLDQSPAGMENGHLEIGGYSVVDAGAFESGCEDGLDSPLDGRLGSSADSHLEDDGWSEALEERRLRLIGEDRRSADPPLRSIAIARRLEAVDPTNGRRDLFQVAVTASSGLASVTVLADEEIDILGESLDQRPAFREARPSLEDDAMWCPLAIARSASVTQ